MTVRYSYGYIDPREVCGGVIEVPEDGGASEFMATVDGGSIWPVIVAAAVASWMNTLVWSLQ